MTGVPPATPETIKYNAPYDIYLFSAAPNQSVISRKNPHLNKEHYLDKENNRQRRAWRQAPL